MTLTLIFLTDNGFFVIDHLSWKLILFFFPQITKAIRGNHNYFLFTAQNQVSATMSARIEQSYHTLLNLQPSLQDLVKSVDLMEIQDQLNNLSIKLSNIDTIYNTSSAPGSCAEYKYGRVSTMMCLMPGTNQEHSPGLIFLTI